MRLFVREVSLVGFKTDSADYWLRLAADRRSNLALFIANDREKERERKRETEDKSTRYDASGRCVNEPDRDNVTLAVYGCANAAESAQVFG